MHFSSLIHYIKTKWHWIVLIILAIAFFLGTSAFNYFSQYEGFIKWTSPDETANYALAKLYAENSKLTYIEPNNLLAKDIVIPRSFRSDYGIVKPVSFLGIILIYGQLASWLGIAILPFLTPIFATLGIIFFYLLIKEWFDKHIALITSILLCFFPVYIYYSSRSMFHNVLFIDLLIVGLYFGTIMIKKDFFPPPGSLTRDRLKHYGTWLAAALSGFFIGLAIITRTSELLWLAPMLGLIWLFNIKKIGLFRLFIWLYFVVIALMPVLYWNIVLYQAPISSGYPQMDESIDTIVENSEAAVASVVETTKAVKSKTFISQIWQTIFHDGFKPAHSLKMAYYYFLVMFPWLLWLSLLGWLVFIITYLKDKKHLAYFIIYPIITIILVFYYGSWTFYDNPDPNSFTIGNSYTRYWLPIYLGALPLVSLAIIYFTRWFKFKAMINIARILVVAIICTWSTYFVMYGSAEGLVPTFERNQEARSQFETVLAMTEKEAIIITQYHDKLFYPERRVTMGVLTDDNLNKEYAKLAKQTPLYYYNFTFPPTDLDYLNNSKLEIAGLKIKTIRQITKDFTLYKLELR